MFVIKILFFYTKGLQIVKWLIESGVGAYVLPMILFYLTLDNLAELASAANLYGLDILSYVEKSDALTDTILFKNHFKRIYAKPDHPRLDYTRLWQLSADELLLEARQLNFEWQELYKTDVLMPIVAENIIQKPIVAYNPVHDIIALVEQTHLFVISYGGTLRSNRGQLLYAESVSAHQVSFLSWNSSGSHLMVCYIPSGELSNFCDRQITMYKYFPDHGYFKKNILPNISLRGSGTMLTSSLWINETSFIWCKNSASPLVLVSLNDAYNEVDVTNLTDNIKTLFQLDNERGGSVCLDNWSRSTHLAQTIAADDFTCQIPASNFGNLFAVPCSRSLHYYCIIRCPVHLNFHDCIGVINRVSLKLVTLIAIPGQIKEVKTTGEKIFVLFSRCNLIQEFPLLNSSRSAKYFEKCPFFIYVSNIQYTWWDNKRTDLCWFTDTYHEPSYMSKDCCHLIYVHHKNRSYRQRCLFDDVCDSRSMQLTPHFVLLTNFSHDSFDSLMSGPDLVEHQRVFTNHHLIESRRDLILPNEIAKTYYYHPTREIVFVHQKVLDKIFPYFGLTRAARLEDITHFPEFEKKDEKDAPFNYPLLSTPKYSNDLYDL